MDAFTAATRANGFTDFNFDYAFRTWERQRGYPVVHISYNSQTGNFELTQERFFEQKSYGVNDTSKWYIPINYATQNTPNFDDTRITDYFKDTESVKLISATPGNWYVFNKQQFGYYRVDYDSANWIAIRDVLNSNNFNQIHVMNRAQLVDDSFALANAGYHNDYSIAFDIMSYLRRENDFFPFYSAFKFLYNLIDVFGPTNVFIRVSHLINLMNF